jgi:hypothetical protein
MRNQERRAGYASLWAFALAFGWIEAAVVVYLREICMREASLSATSDLEGLQITLAAVFVLAGSYLFWTPERERSYRRLDVMVLAGSALLTIAAFLVESRAAIDHRVPQRFHRKAWKVRRCTT